MMSARLQLSLHATKLPNVAGVLHKSDPFAIVTLLGDDPNNSDPIIVGQTEVIYNNLSPSWTEVIILDGYRFGRPLYFEVGIFDYHHKHRRQQTNSSTDSSSSTSRALSESLTRQRASGDISSRYDDESNSIGSSTDLPAHKCMGTALFEVGAILGSRGNVMSKSLKKGGVVYVHLERSKDHGKRGSLRLQIRGLGLVNLQSEILNRKSSPFFEIYRREERLTGSTWNNIFRSNIIMSNLNPFWDEATVDLERFCNGDLGRSIKLCVWDYRRSGKHKLIGEFETSVQRFIDAKCTRGNADTELAFTLRRDGRKTGRIVVIEARIIAPHESPPAVSIPQITANTALDATGRSAPRSIPAYRPQFVDYLSGGCEISLAVAIDFTASNRDPRMKGSLHYFDPLSSNKRNDYEKAILAVGSILAKYDSDQMFPVWGFGAKFEGVVRHCFQCSQDVEVHGVAGVLNAYRGAFCTGLALSFPTVFTHVIKAASSYARRKEAAAWKDGKLSYTILLILTAGDVHDVRETKLALAKACSAPLSVVIVGIGDADFSGMQFLDEHDPSIDPGRDITKFVQFNEYRSFNSLTEAVLDEIPDQLVSYYLERGIMPAEAERCESSMVPVQPADERQEVPSSFLRHRPI